MVRLASPGLVALLGAALALGACRRASDPPPPAEAAEAARQGAERFQAALQEGDAAWERRLDPAGLDAALAAWGRAAAQRPGAVEAELRVARAEAFRGLAAPAGQAAREAWEASARAAERALRTSAPAWAAAIDAGVDPAAAAARVEAAGAEALYLLAQGSMRAAQATGYAAMLAVRDAALAMMARAAELDERVDAAGPHRALGAWRAALPVAAGGGAEASRAHFDRARVLAPDDLLARVAEAETLCVLLQDAARFDALLAEVARADLAAAPARRPENVIAKRRGEALAARKARLF